MTTIRNPRRGLRKLVSRVVTIPQEELLDPRLSLAARGLLATMYADPELRGGEDRNLPQTPEVQAAFEELVDAGYIGEPEPLAEVADIDPARAHRASVVYYLRRADGAIKIGFTAHLSTRLKKLASEHGELVLLAVESGGWHLEQARHVQFAALRISDQAEWFRPGEQLRTHIGELAKGSAA